MRNELEQEATKFAAKLSAAHRRIRKIQAEIATGEVQPTILLPSLTKAVDAAYRVARYIGPDADERISELTSKTSEALETGQELYRMRLGSQADFAAGRAELQRKRIDPDSFRGELDLAKIWK